MRSLPAGGLGATNDRSGSEPVFTVTKGASDIWANFQFFVNGTRAAPPDPEAPGPHIELEFSSGGQQGPWGSGAAPGWWFVENALGLLDEPREWFARDGTAPGERATLFYKPNGTAELSGPMVASTLDSLIEIRGTAARPVQDIVIEGIGFMHTEVAYNKQYESHGGGGITIHRGGALVIEGAVGVTVSDCLFDSVGGHGIVLSDFVRHATIEKSEFRWIGDSAIVSLGSTALLDATAELYPIGNRIISNLIHEVGIYAKQGCGYYQAKSAATTIFGNIIFGGPRAGIELTDAMGGGHLLERNLMFDLTRETTDQ